MSVSGGKWPLLDLTCDSLEKMMKERKEDFDLR